MFRIKTPRGLAYFSTMLLLALALAACGQPPTSGSIANPSAAPLETTANAEPSVSGEIVVFAAASLTESYTELGRAFESIHPDTTVTFNFAGSQQLAQQIGQGAPADVFASANTKQMNVAIDYGRVVSGTQQVFAHNRLVIVVSTNSSVAVTHLDDLAAPNLKLILAAQEVPVGSYSRAFLDKATTEETLGTAYTNALLANVVSYEQTVKAVLTKVVLGEGDAGIVYSSDITSDVADRITTVDIPDHLNTIATYPIALVNDSANPRAAQAFIEYVRSPDGQAVLQAHGFLPVTLRKEPD